MRRPFWAWTLCRPLPTLLLFLPALVLIRSDEARTKGSQPDAPLKVNAEVGHSLNIRLTPHIVTVGEEALVEMVVPEPPKYTVRYVSYTCHQIAFYHRSLDVMVYPKQYVWLVLTDDEPSEIAGLGTTFASHGFALDPLIGGVGIEQRIRPNRIGVYLITGVWHCRRQNDDGTTDRFDISTQPGILFVEPPIVDGAPDRRVTWGDATRSFADEELQSKFEAEFPTMSEVRLQIHRGACAK